MSSLYTRILEQTERLGITGKQLGALLGLKKSPLTDWKNQKSTPTLSQFERMCEIFATSPNYLLYGSDEHTIAANIGISPADPNTETSFTDVGHRIMQRIKELGISLSEVCDKSGLSTASLNQYCAGEYIPDTLSLYRIATALNVSMEWILTGNNTEHHAPDLNAVKRAQGLMRDDLPLSENETDLVAMFRLLPPAHREEVFDLVYFKYSRTVEQEKGSIYSTYFDDGAERNDGESSSSIA